ncbi:PadR family transcriptional regulator [Streptomyces aureus]|uniref:PadR family transcriptional regulator n=1 Tax=Streptomyces aureus TaxID=193461 RepID=UPI0034029917
MFQLKYYPDGFPTTSHKGRRGSIRQSFVRAMRGAPQEWVLVVPCVLTLAERAFVLSLASGLAVGVEVWDRAKLDDLLAVHADLEASFAQDQLFEAAKVYGQERAVLREIGVAVASGWSSGTAAISIYGRPSRLGRRIGPPSKTLAGPNESRWALRGPGPYVKMLLMNVRVTVDVARVLKEFLREPSKTQYGYALMQATEFPSGKLYPILRRLEKAGVLIKETESIDPQAEGRPARRLYRITSDGAVFAREELAKLSQSVSLPFSQPGRLFPEGGV